MKQLYERGQGLVCVSFAMVTVVKRVSRRKKFISLLLALVMALSLVAFARALGEYGATSMVAGYTPGKTATVSTTVYQLWQINNDALAMKWVMVNMAISDEAVCLPEGPYSAVVQRVVRDLHATVVLLRPVNGGEEVMLRAILPEGAAAAAAGETVRFDLLAEKCLCCG